MVICEILLGVHQLFSSCLKIKIHCSFAHFHNDSTFLNLRRFNMHVQVPRKKKIGGKQIEKKGICAFFLPFSLNFSFFEGNDSNIEKNVNRVNNMTEQWKSQEENVKKKRKFLRWFLSTEVLLERISVTICFYLIFLFTLILTLTLSFSLTERNPKAIWIPNMLASVCYLIYHSHQNAWFFKLYLLLQLLLSNTERTSTLMSFFFLSSISVVFGLLPNNGRAYLFHWNARRSYLANWMGLYCYPLSVWHSSWWIKIENAGTQTQIQFLFCTIKESFRHFSLFSLLLKNLFQNIASRNLYDLLLPLCWFHFLYIFYILPFDAFFLNIFLANVICHWIQITFC